MNIVIVDDDPVILELLKRSLSRTACHAQCFSDGLEALEHLKTAFADLLIVDFRMPKLNGLELLSQMARGGGIRATTTWLCSAASFPAEVRTAAEDMGVRLISKELFSRREGFLAEVVGESN